MLPIVKLFLDTRELKEVFDEDIERLKNKGIPHKAHFGLDTYISADNYSTVQYLTYEEYKKWCIGRIYILYGEPYRSGLPADDIVLKKGE